MTKFITIASSKGGVGKTTTAINLGTAMTIFGRDVIVVDANLTTPNVSLYLGASNVAVTLHDVLKRHKKIKDAVYLHSHGLKIVPAGQSIKDSIEIDYEDFAKHLKGLHGMVEYVIIDSPSGLGQDAINSLKVADEIIVVSIPELPAISDALRTIKIAQMHGKKIIGIVLTRVYEDQLELSKEDVESILELPVLGIIPEDDSVRESVKIKGAVTHTHPNAPSSLGYKRLAAKILGEKYIESVEKADSTLDYMLKRLGMK